jgi:hypothetical protein
MYIFIGDSHYNLHASCSQSIDSNCTPPIPQFRALSDQLYQTPDHHEFVREQIISQLKTNRDAYDGYVPMAYDDYLEKVARNGEWGDHVTLQAAADKVSLYTIDLPVVAPVISCCV